MNNDVRELRTRKGLSQGRLAQEMDVSRQTINAIETDRYTPSLPPATALARFFARRRGGGRPPPARPVVPPRDGSCPVLRQTGGGGIPCRRRTIKGGRCRWCACCWAWPFW